MAILTYFEPRPISLAGNVRLFTPVVPRFASISGMFLVFLGAFLILFGMIARFIPEIPDFIPMIFNFFPEKTIFPGRKLIFSGIKSLPSGIITTVLPGKIIFLGRFCVFFGQKIILVPEKMIFSVRSFRSGVTSGPQTAAAASNFPTPTCPCVFILCINQADSTKNGLARFWQLGFPSGQRWGVASVVLGMGR